MKQIFIVVCLVLNIFNAEAQDIAVKGAKGEWAIHNITPEQAFNKALFEAKADALKKAGIPEYISSLEALITDNVDQYYSGINNIEIDGDIIDFAITEKKTETVNLDGFSYLIAKITIDATVRRYKENKDLSFQLSINGIEAMYTEGNVMSFNITPSQDGYLKIFFFEHNNSGELLYPSSYESNRKFIKNKTVTFPMNPRIDYTLEKINNKASSELNKVIFVFTKDDIPFPQREIDYHAMLSWIAKIKPDRRTVTPIIYRIVKKNNEAL